MDLNDHCADDVLDRPPETDPAGLYELWEAAAGSGKRFCAVAAAVRLKLFDFLETPCPPAALAARAGTDPQLTATLCALLSDMGLLERNADGFACSPVSRAFLHSRSAYYQGAVIADIESGMNLWRQLDTRCRSGPLSIDPSAFFENTLIDSLAAEILTGELQRTVAAIIRQPGFGTARRMLDLGGGHGMYAMALCARKPDLAAVVFDVAPMAAVFNRYRERFGGTGATFLAGNLFTDDIGTDFDLVFYSYNPGGKNPRVLEKIHRCLRPGGLFITKHAFYRRDEGCKSRLLDLEWQMCAVEGTAKQPHVYAFGQDVCLEHYMELLRQSFVVQEVIEAEAFATPALSKFGDRLDSKMIMARKKG